MRHSRTAKALWPMMVGLALLYWGCEGESTAETGKTTKAGHGERHAGDKKHERHQGGGHHSGHEAGQGGKSGKYGGHEGGAGGRHVKLTQKAEKRYALETKKAEAGSLDGRVSAPATVKHVPSQKLRVSPLVRGRVSELTVTVGDRVEPGQKLAVMRSIELGTARAQVQQARSDLEIAKTNFERVEALKDEGIVSERRYLEARQSLETARAKLAAARSKLQTYGVGGGGGPFYSLESEIEGRVIEQDASEGEVKGPKESLYLIADNSPVWVIGKVFERDIPKVEEGMEATVTLEAYPSRTWKGRVDWVADTVDSETRNLRVRVELPNKKGDIRPGMFGAVHLKPKHPKESALVPVGAVQIVHGQQVVFRPGDKPLHYRAQPVETGDEGKGLVEIRSGLSPGDAYVTRGAFDLKATMTASSRSGGHHH